MTTVFLFCISLKIITLVLCLTSTSGQELIQMEETTVELCVNGTEDSCEATMEPTSSSFMESTKMTSPTKKTKPTTKLVTKRPSTTKNTSPTSHPNDDCTCDIILGECEINCCCDVDCSAENRAVFTRCGTQPQPVDLDHCFPSHLLYANNTDLKAVQMEPGVLCVAHSNTITTTDFDDVPIVKNVDAFEKRLGRRKHYSWPNPLPSYDQFDADSVYDKGSPLWAVVHNNTITQFVLPSSIGYNSYCHTSVVPKYLEEFSSSCTLYMSSKNDCLKSADEYFSIISSPHNFNFTQPQECTEDVCLPVQQHVCAQTCDKGKLPRQVFNDSTNTCQNVVYSVEYKIYHNGSQGMTEVKAFYKLTNVPVRNENLFRKHFKVDYVWAGSTEQRYLRRSGRPGYIVGKPLISGKHNFKSVTFATLPETWISVGVAGDLGHCSKRRNVLFGENIFTRCFLVVNGSCKQIQQQIWAQLLGPVVNLSEAVISSYGDPRAKDRDTWVPLLFPDPPPLPALTTAFNLIILHTLVGPLAAPREKIIAAYLEPLPSSTVCDVKHLSVTIETSVRFIDKTIPTVTKFAQPPVYEIKLPQDFFYPFFANGKQKCCPLSVQLIGLLLFVHFSSLI